MTRKPEKKRPKPVKQSTKPKDTTKPETAEAKPEETAPEQPAETSGGNGEQKGLGVLAHEGKPKLEREDLFRIEMLYAKMQLEQVKAENCELKAQLKEVQHTLAVRSIRNDGQTHNRESQKWKGVATNFMLSLGPKYGVDFTKCGYDDETGTIHVLEPDGIVKRETAKK